MITINLPFPPPQLSPNARCGWRARAAHVQTYRYECTVMARSQWLDQFKGVDVTPPMAVTITFILKDKRRHDWDNLLASFKAGIDGIVDAGLLPDDDVRSWSPTLRFEQGDKAGVRVELEAEA